MPTHESTVREIADLFLGELPPETTVINTLFEPRNQRLQVHRAAQMDFLLRPDPLYAHLYGWLPRTEGAVAYREYEVRGVTERGVTKTRLQDIPWTAANVAIANQIRTWYPSPDKVYPWLARLAVEYMHDRGSSDGYSES